MRPQSPEISTYNHNLLDSGWNPAASLHLEQHEETQSE